MADNLYPSNPSSYLQVVQVTPGGLTAAVKGASTAPTVADASLVVGESPFLFSHQAGAVSVQIKAGAGVLHSVSINTKGTASTATLYDSLTASGSVIAVIDTTLNQDTLLYDVGLTVGLFIVVTGTLSDLTVSYK